MPVPQSSEKQVAIRPLSKAETTVLRSHISSESVGETLLGAVIVIATTVVITAGIALAIGTKASKGIAIATGAAVFTGLLYCWRKLASARTLPEPLADLRTGMAHVRGFSAKDAILVREFEDNGPGVYLDVGEGKVLYLGGPYLQSLLADRLFPATTFDVAYAPRSHIVVGVYSRGDYLNPTFTKRAFTEAEIVSRQTPTDGELLECDFQTLRSK
jgi:hypothetical protein